jgi:xanthosine utilization system XapX-like protein
MHMLQQAHGAIALSKQQQQPAGAPGGGWQHLAAALVAASVGIQQHPPWCTQRWAAQLSAAAAGTAGRLQLLRQPGPYGSRSGLVAGGSSDVACIASGARLQWAVQHLLGVLIGLNLFLQQQVLLEGAAAAAAWLQEGVLEPHIQWLTQAHPGVCVCVARPPPSIGSHQSLLSAAL